MKNLQSEKILSTVESESFIGRSHQLERILKHAQGESKFYGLRILSAPAVGASELLKQAFDRLFHEQTELIPFYFALRKSDKTPKKAALRFLQEFVLQTVAFRRQNAQLIHFGGDLEEISQIAVPSDIHWIDRLIESACIENSLNDERAFIRTALSAPLRAFANGAKAFVMIDNLDEILYLEDGTDFQAELTDIFSRFEFPFVFASKRRFRETGDGFEKLYLDVLSFTDAGLLAETLAGKLEVRLTDQTRDLLAVQLGGNPMFIRFLLQSAADRKMHLENYIQVQKIYTDEIFGGRLNNFYNKVFDKITDSVETQKHLSGLLYDALTLEKEKTHIEDWQFRTNLSEKDFYRTMSLLNIHEIINLTTNLIKPMRENQVLTDYLEARFRLETVAQNRALTVAESLSEFLQRAPRLMANFYCKKSALGLRQLLSAFNLQEIPRLLIDYSAFKQELKGASNEEIFKTLEEEKEKIVLPRIVYTAQTAAFYPQFANIIEENHSAVALGFQKYDYTEEDKVVWLTAELDSKLEASKDLTEFWCDRLEMVALMCDFTNFRLWLIAPEGFSPAATEVLRSRNAFGSSRKQAELLIDYLNARQIVGEKPEANEYEMIVPMGEDTEMIAAQTVEEIARRHHFTPKAINQIKTALVEACINAAEHSQSPDRKIYQKFKVEEDKITITVANRGLRLVDKKAQEVEPQEGRRGWGLKLIKNLMDEVKMEQTDDGTRISMIKYLQPAS
jgi:serine/threonine-protein kinase RsbW